MKYLCAILLLLFLCAGFPLAGSPLEKFNKIVVVSDDTYPPYIFRDAQGVLHGIIVDQWKLWEHHTGIHVELHAMPWNDALSAIRDGNADVIDTIFFTRERARLYDFTRPYATIDVPVFFNKNISGITDVASIMGFTVGVKKGDTCVEILKQNGISSIQEFNSYEELIRRAADGQIKVFCVDKPPALYYLYKMDLEKEFHYSFTLYSGQFHRAVRKGNSDLLDCVEKGFSIIPSSELERVDRKWIGSMMPSRIEMRYLIYGGIAALVLLLNLVYINLLLRRRIRMKTEQLQGKIQELIVSEAQKKSFIAAIPDVIFIISRDGRILDYNSPSLTMLAVKPEEFLGKKISELPLPASLIREILINVEVSLSSGKIQRFVYDMSSNSDMKMYEARIAPYDATSVLWIRRDITDSIHKDEQLLQAQKMETIGNLAGGLAHDFNNVLGGIIGTASLLKYALADGLCKPEEISRDIASIEEIAKRGADIVSQLLSVSKHRDMTFGLTDLKQSVKQVISICRNTFDKSVEFSIVFCDGHAYINGDKAQIEQVILNLCINAYHAMTLMRQSGEKIGGVLTVRVEQVEKDSDFYTVHQNGSGKSFVCVLVSDTGVGMDAYTQSRVFEPFFTTKGTSRGTGLGLTMVLNIVQQHGGFIDLFSEPGKGSTFRVSFPVAVETDAAVTEESPETVQRGTGTILIVDDEEIIRDTASRILEYCGYTVLTASDGEQGIDLFRKEHQHIDGIILDMSMPRMSGLDALGELKKIDPSAKILLSSGFRDDPRVQECISIGVGGFIQKPFTLSEFAANVYFLLHPDEKTPDIRI